MLVLLLLLAYETRVTSLRAAEWNQHVSRDRRAEYEREDLTHNDRYDVILKRETLMGGDVTKKKNRNVEARRTEVGEEGIAF
jgi:hypothetical protein